MAFVAALRHGRSPKDGYRRGWGLEFGTLRQTIRETADFQQALSYATDRTVVTVDSLLVYPGGSLTISGKGNIFLHGAVSDVGVNSLLRLKQTAGKFVEESRNF